MKIDKKINDNTVNHVKVINEQYEIGVLWINMYVSKMYWLNAHYAVFFSLLSRVLMWCMLYCMQTVFSVCLWFIYFFFCCCCKCVCYCYCWRLVLSKSIDECIHWILIWYWKKGGPSITSIGIELCALDEK